MKSIELNFYKPLQGYTKIGEDVYYAVSPKNKKRNIKNQKSVYDFFGMKKNGKL